MAKFNEAVDGLDIGMSVYCPAPFDLPDPGQVKMLLVNRNEKGLCHLEVTLFGIKLGDLYGKTDGDLSGWRFTGTE